MKNKKSIEVCFEVTDSHLCEINKWLRDEDEKDQVGFFCNWNTIISLYEKNQLVVFLVENKVVGFLAYGIGDFVAEIYLAEIKYSERGKGYGKQMVEECLVFFKYKGILAVKLYCEPASSQPIWRSMGFEESPKFPYDDRKWMYRILVNSMNMSNEVGIRESIKLWNKEPHECNEDNVSWCWCVEYKNDTDILVRPIIFPVSYEWNISWNIGDFVDTGTKVKRFRGCEQSYEGFLIIQELDRSRI